MAGLFIPSQGVDIDYSCIDGRVTFFKLKGEVLVNEPNIYMNGWKEELAKVIIENKPHVDDGNGLHAFVIRAMDDLLGNKQCS